MKFTPHEYQKYCIERILDTPKIGLFLDMGLGKTITTLSAIVKLKYERFLINKVLVIAPKTVAEGTWSNEAQKWDHTSFLRVSVVMGTAKKRMKALEADADIYVTNRENVPWIVDTVMQNWPFDMVVIDESSSFKDHNTARYKAIKAELPRIKRLALLTGTPSPNGYLDLWAQIYLLDRGERLFPYITHYRSRYFQAGRINHDTGKPFDYRLVPGAADRILELISDICISMKSEDYLTLPDRIDHIIPVILDPNARAKYIELEEEKVLEMLEEIKHAETRKEKGEIYAASAAALSNKLLQLSNGAIYDDLGEAHKIHDCKLEALMELLESLQEKPLLVFYSFQSDKDRILERLAKTKKRVRVLKGQADVDDWNDHKIDVLLAHPASCAYGLNLQQGGNHVCWFGLTWNYEQYAQANKRLHRQGQTEKVIIHHLVCKGTRDEDVMAALEHKDEAQQYVMESLKARIEKYA